MLKRFSLATSFVLLCTLSFAQESGVKQVNQSLATQKKATHKKTSPTPFTGKVIGNKVRIRTSSELDSSIVAELPKDELVVVTAEKGDFYAINPPADQKAYIFRGFVIDGFVEGEKVNVRLFPDRDAAVIGHYSSGEAVTGKVCPTNNKWLEISAPPNTQFYVAKEFIEYAGNIDLKATHDKRKETVAQLFESANVLSQSEMRKAFNEIDIERLVGLFHTIINDYADFPLFTTQATQALAQIQEDYLHQKIAFLENKTSRAESGTLHSTDGAAPQIDVTSSPSDRMKVWEPLEEALYLTWSSMHHAKTMYDFYEDQKLKAKTVSGILESFKVPVKNRPGDFILKDQDGIPVGYVYSTHINLEELIGKQVSILVSERSNNNFAFPAYYVLDAK